VRPQTGNIAAAAGESLRSLGGARRGGRGTARLLFGNILRPCVLVARAECLKRAPLELLHLGLLHMQHHGASV